MARKLGDRKDGTLIRDIDPMHFICPLLYPNRCDNEAFISERIDLTNVNKYLEKKNKGNEGYHYNLFQILVTTALKTITLRPKMNRFIANKNMYQRNEVTASFVVRKEFKDGAHEGLAVIHSKPEDTIETVHDYIDNQIHACRSEELDKSSDEMDIFNKMPRFFSKFLVSIICWLDKHGWVPQSLIETDPYYTSVLLTNLGSIKLHSGYHHLTNWGTCSCFIIVGEQKKREFVNEDGTREMKDSIDLGLTIDERLADGYYYSKTVKLIKYLLEHPEELEKPLNHEVKY